MFGILVGTILESGALHVVAVVQKDEMVAQLGFQLFEDKSIISELVVTAVSISGFDKCPIRKP